MTTHLPVADSRTVRKYVGTLARRHPRMLYGALALHVLAAVAGLAAPRLLGGLVEAVEKGTTVGHVDKIIGALACFLVAQTVLTRFARYLSQVLGEQVLAELREDFVDNTLALPVGVVEDAGSGDLLTRTSRDVDQLGWSVRMALPEWTIAVITAVLTKPTELDLPFACWTLDRLVAYLSDRGIAMRRSRISEIFIREGLKWRHEETWFGERVDPDFAKKRGSSSSSTPRRRRAA